MTSPAASNPVTRLQQHRTRTVIDAFDDMPAMKKARARQERLDRAAIAGRITAGMSDMATHFASNGAASAGG